MNITLENNRITVNAQQLKNLIKLDFELLRRGVNLPPLLIWGESGVGKTTIIHDTLAEIKEENGDKDIKIYEYRLGTKTSANALGLHFVDTESKTTIRYLNNIFSEIVNRSEKGLYSILFLDEFSLGWDAANSLLDAINFKEKRIDGRDFSKVLIIAAGNYIKEYVARFNPAVWTRFARINYKPEAEEVAEYISKKTRCIHVSTYLKLYPSEIIIKDEAGYYIMTPREWEAVAILCCGVKTENKELLDRRIETIGGSSLKNFLLLRDEITAFPTVEEILKNPAKYFENDPEYKKQTYFLYTFLNNTEKILKLRTNGDYDILKILDYYYQNPNPVGHAIIRHLTEYIAVAKVPASLKNKVLSVVEKYNIKTRKN